MLLPDSKFCPKPSGGDACDPNLEACLLKTCLEIKQTLNRKLFIRYNQQIGEGHDGNANNNSDDDDKSIIGR